MYPLMLRCESGDLAEGVGDGAAMAGREIALIAQQRHGAIEFVGQGIEQVALLAEVALEIAEEFFIVAVVAQLVPDGLGRAQARLMPILDADRGQAFSQGRLGETAAAR